MAKLKASKPTGTSRDAGRNANSTSTAEAAALATATSMMAIGFASAADAQPEPEGAIPMADPQPRHDPSSDAAPTDSIAAQDDVTDADVPQATDAAPAARIVDQPVAPVDVDLAAPKVKTEGTSDPSGQTPEPAGAAEVHQPAADAEQAATTSAPRPEAPAPAVTEKASAPNELPDASENLAGLASEITSKVAAATDPIQDNLSAALSDLPEPAEIIASLTGAVSLEQVEKTVQDALDPALGALDDALGDIGSETSDLLASALGPVDELLGTDPTTSVTASLNESIASAPELADLTSSVSQTIDDVAGASAGATSDLGASVLEQVDEALAPEFIAPVTEPISDLTENLADLPASLLGGSDRSDGGLLTEIFYDDGAGPVEPLADAAQSLSAPVSSLASEAMPESLGFLGQAIGDDAGVYGGMLQNSNALHLI